MNTHTHIKRRLLIYLAAATLALTLTLGQAALGKVMGIELAPAVFACQNSGGGGC